MIEVRGLSKRYGDKIAVNDLSFSVAPGKVTGFLGPNGAGKTTTMRLILGLDYPDAGDVAIGGKHYANLAYPMREVGALIDAKAVHGGRSAYNHLLCLAQTNNLPRRRVGEVLELVGLTVGVATPQPDLLAEAVAEAGGTVITGGAADGSAGHGTLTVRGLVAAQVGDLAFEHGVRLHELTVVRASLEAAFMELTADSVEYRGGEGQEHQVPG